MMLNELLNRIKVLKKLSYLPGHFYSPVVMPEEIEYRKDKIFEISNKSLAGIDLNNEKQLQVLNNIKEYYKDLPFTFLQNDKFRYYYDNTYFSYNSAIELYGLIRFLKPRRIIEIGSGFSSALMMDTNDIHMNGSIKFIFIEPFPERLMSLLKIEDKNDKSILQNKVQDVDLKYFADLQENDILFVDSSHVSKTGSDLNHIIFEILPILQKGVIIHFHDIFYPFEYPENWAINSGGFGWNENYILHAFLMYNPNYEIVLFNTYMEKFHEDWFVENMPDCLKRQGGSLFIRKVI